VSDARASLATLDAELDTAADAAVDVAADARSPRQSGPSVTRATALVVLAACCFGTISILTVVATRDGMQLSAVLAWRYLLAVPALALLSGGLRRLRAPTRGVAGLLVLGGGGQALVTALTLSSLAYLSAATLAFLFYTYPAWVAIFAALGKREPLTARRGVALAFSLGGVGLMVGAPGALHPTGVLLALAGAVTYALYIPLLGRLQGTLAPAVASAWVSVGAGVICAAAVLAQGAAVTPPTPAAWLCVVVLAVVCTALAFIAFLRGLAVLGAVRTAIVATVEPFWTAVLGALLLAQPLRPAVFAGGLCIAISVWLLQWRPRAS
jgi:drug/metabolite transporter (DMT)-like permease